MDELTQRLRREYLATGDPQAGIGYMQSLLRTSGVQDQILREAGRDYNGNPEFIYIGWIPGNAYIRFIVLIRDYGLEIEPPIPKIKEHMEEYEYYNYESSWSEYLNQTRGILHILIYDYSYDLEDDSWELQESEHLDGLNPESTTMEMIRNHHYPILGGTIESAEDDIIILNRLHENVSFKDELPELDEEPVLETGRCEDFPACGHDICPDRWSDGRQADMKCVCGASVPITSRYSLCQRCLHAPDPDDPYGGHYDEGGWADFCSEHGGHVEDCPECPDCGYNEHECEC